MDTGVTSKLAKKNINGHFFHGKKSKGEGCKWLTGFIYLTILVDTRPWDNKMCIFCDCKILLYQCICFREEKKSQ